LNLAFNGTFGCRLTNRCAVIFETLAARTDFVLLIASTTLDQGLKEKGPMHSAIPKPNAANLPVNRWLLEHGQNQIEQLFRAIICQTAAPILIADDERNNCEATAGVAKILGQAREKIIGRKMDDFAEPGFKPQISEIWSAFLKKGEQQGTLRLEGPNGRTREVEYTAKGNVLPVRHLVFLNDKTQPASSPVSAEAGRFETSSWVRDYALLLLDADGCVAAWYSGAARIYGYTESECLGRHESFFHAGLLSGEAGLKLRLQDELKRSASEGHFGTEGWQIKKDGSRFWANTITMGLKDENGELQGFARVVRDFSQRQDKVQKLVHIGARRRTISAQSTVAGLASGGIDQALEMNDALLDLLGFDRKDLLAGHVHWSDLTPPEYAALDEQAHEESLRFGTCTPFEKQLIRKDGTPVRVLVTTAILKISPFRWLTFVQDLRERDRMENVNAENSELKQDFGEIIGESAALRRVQRQTEVVAPTDATVLILGETGTGKELVARAIHRLSPRKNLPFVTLNCAAIPTGLLESELFGYERGAFTGALSQKIGRFEMANRGTLFLDEVGDIPLDLQPKLLRALQEKSFERLGGTKTIPIDVRLVAATNRNLTQMMGDKLFRSDLYYRLKVFPIITPPLRDHPEDIPTLARFFTRRYAAKMGRQIEKIPAESLRALVDWQWPGNVRELENFIERSVILSRGPNLRIPLAEIRPDAVPIASNSTLEQVEREHIIRVLRESGGVVTTAATRLGLHRTTLNAMMRKLGITRNSL
jgi:formate hydrogenlyase transcriptional activator